MAGDNLVERLEACTAHDPQLLIEAAERIKTLTWLGTKMSFAIATGYFTTQSAENWDKAVNE